MNEFPKQLLKKISNEIHNISLLFHTVLESEDSSLSPTVQLDCSLTLEMSDQQNKRLAKPSDILSNFLRTICTSWGLFYKKPFANQYIFKLGVVKNFFVV